RVSEIRAAMLNALDLEDEPSSTDALDDGPPSTDHTAAADTTTRRAAVTKPVRKNSSTRMALGVVAVGAVAVFGIAWMQSQKAGAASTTDAPGSVPTAAETAETENVHANAPVADAKPSGASSERPMPATSAEPPASA